MGGLRVKGRAHGSYLLHMEGDAWDPFQSPWVPKCFVAGRNPKDRHGSGIGIDDREAHSFEKNQER